MRLSILARATVSCLAIALMLGNLASPARAKSPAAIPIKVAILIDESFPTTDSRSLLYTSLTDVLTVNKVPFEVFDISDLRTTDLTNAKGEARYAALAIMGPGWKMTPGADDAVLKAAAAGTGLVALLPDVVNQRNMKLFGIKKPGTEWLESSGIHIERDVFTCAYAGRDLKEPAAYLDHTLADGAEAIASFDSGEPAVWIYQGSHARAVFHDHTGTALRSYRGILLESILYVMPVGLASPVNAGAIEVDDFPRPFATAAEVQEYYYDFFTNFRRWLQAYHLPASFYLSFSYSGNTSDFWEYPESLRSVHDILASGYEIGLHNGSRHVPLDAAYWSRSELLVEVDITKKALDRLRSTLYQEYGDYLSAVDSYVAPDGRLGPDGYKQLAQRLGIRYAGTLDPGGESLYEGDGHSVPQTIPPTLRNFGREGDTGVYNLPRSEGGFYYFGRAAAGTARHDQSWATLLSAIESGDSYIIFTHPSDTGIAESAGRTPRLEDFFSALNTWGEFVSRHYPFYRWWTATRLGDYLAERQGFTGADWLPDEKTLRVTPAQAQDVIRVKTDKYLSSVSRDGGTVVLKFSDAESEIVPGDYDVVRCGQDYFLSPKGTGGLPVTPGSAFVFARVTPPRPIEPAVSLELPPAPANTTAILPETAPPPPPAVTSAPPSEAAVLAPARSDNQVAPITGPDGGPGNTIAVPVLGLVPVEVFASFAFAAFLFIVGIILTLRKR